MHIEWLLRVGIILLRGRKLPHQQLREMPVEMAVIDTFRRIDDEYQDAALAALEALARTFPKGAEKRRLSLVAPLPLRGRRGVPVRDGK